MDDTPAEEVAFGLIDLTDADLEDLTALDNAVLASALQRIKDEIEHPEEAVAGFNSSI